MTTPLQARLHNKSKSFHAEIARRAAELRPPVPRTYTIPNAPYGQRKPGVKILQPPKRYVHPKEFNVAYEEAWFLEICGIKIPEWQSSAVLMGHIKRTVASFYSMTVRDLLSHRRTRPFVIPRQVAMFLCRELTLRSTPEIGRAFAGRDHTTIIHACRKIEALISTDPDVARIVEALRSQCKGGVGNGCDSLD